MAALTPTTIATDGTNIFRFSGAPVRYRLTTGSVSDTFVLPGGGAAAWAVKTDVTATSDTQHVTYTASTQTFTITSATGGGAVDIFVWPSVK